MPPEFCATVKARRPSAMVSFVTLGDTLLIWLFGTQAIVNRILSGLLHGIRLCLLVLARLSIPRAPPKRAI